MRLSFMSSDLFGDTTFAKVNAMIAAEFGERIWNFFSCKYLLFQ